MVSILNLIFVLIVSRIAYEKTVYLGIFQLFEQSLTFFTSLVLPPSFDRKHLLKNY